MALKVMRKIDWEEFVWVSELVETLRQQIFSVMKQVFE